MDCAENLTKLSANPGNIRNFCMVAHVDHGKTSLSDYLLASNGVLSEHLAGEVRYLDSREDEQERQITIKASSIALQHRFQGTDHLMHLVDSPGHIDFSCEVSTAIRVSDTAVIIVDVVDCVTTQTMSMLRQVFTEGLSMVLVLNKIDLIITTMKLTTEEAYLRIRGVIETCNAILASYVNKLEISGERLDLVALAPEDMVWFCPTKGNVAFASCCDGWGFRLADFAHIYEKKLDMEGLVNYLWGHHYIDMNKKKILSEPKREDQPYMIIQLILNPLWKLHEVFMDEKYDEEKAFDISKKLGIDPKVWNRPRTDCRAKMSSLLSGWLPLARSVLDMICAHGNSPIKAQQQRLASLLPPGSLSSDNIVKGSNRPPLLSPALERAILTCDPSDDAPMVAFISKLIDIDTMAGVVMTDKGEFTNECFVGFARVYSGRVKKGLKIVLHTVGEHGIECVISKVFLLRGRGLEEVAYVSAGCLCGIGGVTQHIVKYATVSSDYTMLPLNPPRLTSSSIVRKSVAPVNPLELPKLVRGLKLLNKVDPQVEILVLPTGEHVIGGAGEVHVDRCVTDLKDTFARIEMHVSEPLVSFREAIVSSAGKPKMVYGTTPHGHCTIHMFARALPEECLELMKKDGDQFATESFTTRLEPIIKRCTEKKGWHNIGKFMSWGPEKLGYCGVLLFDGTEQESSVVGTCLSQEGSDKVTDVCDNVRDIDLNGNNNDNTDIVIHGDQGTPESYTMSLDAYRSSIISGFQMVSLAGPMADEPLYGMAFVITKVEFNTVNVPDIGARGLSGQIMTCMNETCRKAIEQHTTGMRLVEPIYDCTVYSSGATHGKIYSLLGRRRANILDTVANEGSDLFYVRCYLPALSSFGLQDELRVQTSGSATAQLQMSHWSIMSEDPYYKPTTKEQLEDDGVVVKQTFAGQTLVNIRKRKGLHQCMVVERGERQKFSIKN